MTGNVLPLLRVIANGRFQRESDNQTCLKFTVVATPEFVPGTAEALAFESWPAEITARLRKNSGWPFEGGLKLYFRPITAECIPPEIAGPKWTELPLQLAAPKAYADETAWNKINALWKKTLVPLNLLESLAKDIKNSLDSKKQTSDLQPSYDSDVTLNSDGDIPTKPYDPPPPTSFAESCPFGRAILPLRSKASVQRGFSQNSCADRARCWKTSNPAKWTTRRNSKTRSGIPKLREPRPRNCSRASSTAMSPATPIR